MNTSADIRRRPCSFRRQAWTVLVSIALAQMLCGATAQEAKNATSHHVNVKHTDMIFKADDGLNWTEIDFRPGKCDSFDQYCLDTPMEDKETGSAALLSKFREQYPHFSEAWMSELSEDITANYNLYRDSDHVGISATGSQAEISTVAIGLVIDNVYGISFLDNKFTVDMKIYVREIKNETPLTSIEQAFADAFEETSVVEHKNDEDNDKPYAELLQDRWENVRSQSRYASAKPVEHSFCSMEYQDQMRLISMEDYTSKFGAGIQIQHSTASPTAVQDENGKLLYVKANGVTVHFDPPNGKFFPFQSDIMDIKLNFPRGREMNRVILCIDPHYTGLNLPLESARRHDENELYLTLIPRITTSRSPPFLGRKYHHLRNPHEDWHHKKLTEGNKVVHSATFTLLYLPDYFDGLSYIYPFLFVIFATELQWLVNFPDNFASAHMVTAILQLQTITNAQGRYLLFRNKITEVIYLTYGITMANILTISLMAFINVCKDKGSLPWLVRMRGLIFRTLRLLTILLAFWLIPILSVKTDPHTGQQQDYAFLYYFVGFGSILVMMVFFLKEYRNAKRLSKEVESVNDDDIEGIMKSVEPNTGWTAEEVGKWIGTCEALREASSLTEGELEAISGKFVEAGVNGEVFPLVAYDTTTLKQDLGLSVGEAVLFVHTMEKMRSSPSSIMKCTFSDVESDGDNQ